MKKSDLKRILKWTQKVVLNLNTLYLDYKIIFAIFRPGLFRPRHTSSTRAFSSAAVSYPVMFLSLLTSFRSFFLRCVFRIKNGWYTKNAFFWLRAPEIGKSFLVWYPAIFQSSMLPLNNIACVRIVNHFASWHYDMSTRTAWGAEQFCFFSGLSLEQLWFLSKWYVFFWP